MGICPICNGFEKLKEKCSSCGKMVEDMGRQMDFYDNYSAYMPIDQMKKEDGFEMDYAKQQCPHVIKCSACGHMEVKLINE